MLEQGSIGQWLQKRCRREHLSLRQAAARTGLSHATIAQVVKSDRASPETIRKLVQGFGGNGAQRLALEDELLILAGYRTERAEGEELTEPLARLIDKASMLNNSQIKMMEHFADFLIEIESEK